jgi:hypothetical protein
MGTIYRDLGHHFPLYAKHGVPTETEYWKQLVFTTQLQDQYFHMASQLLTDGGTAAAEDTVSMGVTPRDCILRGAYAVFLDNALTGQNTNYGTINIINKGGVGTGTAVMATRAFTTGVDAVQYAVTALTVSATAAHRAATIGQSITANLGKTGDGQAFNGLCVSAYMEGMLDTTNLISDEGVLMVAPHKLLVLGVYAVFKEDDITGADTNYFSINIVNKGKAGTGTDEVASIDFTSGVDATVGDDTALTLSTTAANLVVERGEVVVAQLVKVGTGMQAKAVDVVLLAKAIE